MTSGRSCIFCGNQPVSREHVWPDWIAQELSKLDSEPFHVALGAGDRPQRWRSRTFNITVRRFCKVCNNGWMSDIENETALVLRPMMLGRESSFHLSPENQTTLARWAYKTALVADFVLRRGDSPDDHPPIPERAYRDFYRDRTPPNIGCVVWITAYGDSPNAALGRRSTVRFIGVAPNGKHIPGTMQHAFLTTLTAFRAVFQILGYLRGEWAPTSDAPETHPFLIRIWPPTGESVIWPRNGFALDNNTLENFAKRSEF